MSEKTAKMEPKTEYHFNTAKIKPLKKGGFFMELVYDEIHTDEAGKVTVTPVTKEPPFHPHMDMFTALKMLVPHMMIETDFATTKDFNKAYIDGARILEDPKITDLFKVTGVHIKEKHEARHVVIVGRKILRSGKVINLSPMINIDDLEEGYVYAEATKTAVDNFINEVALYTEGKHAPDAQLKMFAEEGKAEAKSDEASEQASVPKEKAGKKAS